MATKQIIYPASNPIAAYPVITVDPSYNSVPLELETGLGYAHKAQTTEGTDIQILSDWVPIVKVYRENHTTYITPAVTQVATGVTGQTFLVYQCHLDFPSWLIGRYYFEISYIDTGVTILFRRSRIIDLKAKWPLTRRFEYRNNQNDFGAVYDTGITFNSRVEGSLIKYVPSFIGNTYTDQQNNATKLPSNIFDKKTLSLGNSPGLPDWMGQLYNCIMQHSDIKIDGTYYQIVEGQEWDVADRPLPEQADAETLANYSINVMVVTNSLLLRLRTGGVNVSGFKAIEQVTPLFNVATNQSVNLGIWNLLTEIVFGAVNVGFTLSLSAVSMGASDLGVFIIPTGKYCIDLRDLESAPTTIYLSGMTGVGGLTCDIFVNYKDLNAIATPTGNPPVPVTAYKPGSVIMYMEVNSGDFSNDFDVVTGLGKSGGNYPNFRIVDTTDNYISIWKRNGSMGTIGSTFGADDIVLTDVSQLPPFSVETILPNTTGRGVNYESNNMQGGGGRGLWYDPAQTVPSTSVGASAPIVNHPLGLVMCLIQCMV